MRLPSLCALALAAAAPAQDTAPALRVLRTVFLEGTRTHCLAWSPDGASLASGGACGEVTILDAATGAVRHVLEASDRWIGGLRFSPDGRRLAVLGQDLSVWRADTGALVARCAAEAGRALDWSRDGTRIAVMRDSSKAALLDAGTLREVRTFAAHDGSTASALALTKDAGRLALGKRSGATYVFDTKTGALLQTLAVKGWVRGAAWLDDGRLLRAGWNGDHVLLGGAPGEVAPREHIHGLVAQPDGSRCALWTDAAVELHTPAGAPVRVPGGGPVALHGDGRHWARVLDGTVEVFAGSERLRSFGSGNRAEPTAAVISGDGRFVAATTQESALQVYDIATGARVPAPEGTGTPLLLQNRGGPELVVARGRGIRFVLPFTGRAGRPGGCRVAREVTLGQSLRPTPRQQARLDTRGRLLCVGDRVFDLAAAGAVRDLRSVLVSQAVPEPYGKWIAGVAPLLSDVGRGTGDLLVLGRDRGAALYQRRVPALPSDLDVAPDGALIAYAAGEQSRLVDVESFRDRQVIERPWMRVRFLDKRWLAGADDQGGLELLRVGDRGPAATLQLGAWLRSLEVSADGARGVVALQDRLVVFEVRR